jgi:Family of unknown function (DUF5675)
VSNMKLQRTRYTADGIFGWLLDSSGNGTAHTLEHSYDLKPKLPAGTYKCVRGKHQLHGGIPFETFEVTGVAGHSGILFHVGNYNKDSDGCILLGAGTLPGMITNSRLAFALFMDSLRGINEFTLEVLNDD